MSVSDSATSRFWLLASLAVIVACGSTQTTSVRSAQDQKPFRAVVFSYPWNCPSIAASLHRNRLIGVGNVKYFGWTDEIVVWGIPGLENLAQVELNRKDHFDGNSVALCPALSSDGQSFAYRDRLDSVLVRDVLGAARQTRVTVAGSGFDRIRFRSSDQELVALVAGPHEERAGETSIQLLIHDLATGEQRRHYLGRPYPWLVNGGPRARAAYRAKHPEEGIAMMTLSPRGEAIAFFRVPEGKLAGAVEVWEVDPWRRKLAMDYPFGLGSLTFSDDEAQLAVVSTGARSGSMDANSLRVIDISRETAVLDVETIGEPNHSYFADFSPDGMLLATGTRYNGVQIWDLATGQRVGYSQLGGGRSMSTGLAFSQDGRKLFVMNDSGELRAIRVQDILDTSRQSSD